MAPCRRLTLAYHGMAPTRAALSIEEVYKTRATLYTMLPSASAPGPRAASAAANNVGGMGAHRFIHMAFFLLNPGGARSGPASEPACRSRIPN